MPNFKLDDREVPFAQGQRLIAAWPNAQLRETHELCEKYNDVATASLIEVWIDEAERRTWFLYEASRHGEPR